jgi:hypothetical protein
MPNWCDNCIVLRHADPKMIDRALNSKGLLMEFLPTPQELLDTVAGYMGNTEEQAALEAQQRTNIERYGYKHWYDWNCANWGTKWDRPLEIIDFPDVNTLSAYFESAWSPPVQAYRKLEELGFEIEAYYVSLESKYFGRYTTEYGEDLLEFEEYGEGFGLRRSSRLFANRLQGMREPEKMVRFLQNVKSQLCSFDCFNDDFWKKFQEN